MAGHDTQNFVPHLIHFPALAVDVHFIDDIEQKLFIISPVRRDGTALIINVSVAEIFDQETELLQFRKIFGKQDVWPGPSSTCAAIRRL